LDAEYFIDKNEDEFEFDHNPFKSDIAGKQITFTDLVLEDKLNLKADLSTLRTAGWLKSEAYVIADIQNAPYAPRNVLRAAMTNNNVASVKVDKLTFQLIK